MEEEKFYTIILRHDDSTKWMINDPILALGEYGVEDDTHRIKRGDGRSKWSELQYEHFGLEYMITFTNLQGQVEDNLVLKQTFDTKVDKLTFEDVQNNVVAGLTITSEEGKIGKVTKVTKDVVLGATKQMNLLIQSTDQSIQGFWSIDETGMEILNLKANASIDDYEAGRKYFVDQICFYDNILYRAVEDFEAGVVFEPTKWVKLASLHSDDIKYDNKISGLESKTVKKALDELADLDSQKVEQTRRPFKVYGTNEDGEQMLYDKDSLRTVDSVNGIEANPTSKNIQIDAKGINYDDEAETKQTIKEVLDSKVDKVVAGEGAKIVRDVIVAYNEETGKITLTEDKVSLEDGSAETQTSEVDVASNTELQNTKTELNDRITEEVKNLNDRITDEVQSLNDTIDKNDAAINERVDREVETLNTTIDANKVDIEDKLSKAQLELQTNIDTTNARITTEVATLNTRIDTEVATLNNTIDANKTDIETKLADEVKTLNQTIDTNETEINARVDREVADLNKTITDNKIEINDKVDANKADIEDKLTKGLNTKIDKDIADSILVGIGVSTEPGEKLDEPTLKIVAKNTDTKTEIVKHIHFAEKGVINVTKENDHIVIDSSEIDLQVKNNKEAIEANDVEINALQEHDLVHDKELATHAQQIANHETRMLAAEESIVRIDETIEDLTEKHENDITAVNTVNADQEAHLTRIDLTLDEHDERINENANSIIETNKNVSKNLESINALQETKLDKNFTEAAGDRVVSNILLQELTGNNIANARLTGVIPTTKQVLTKNFVLASSDNTLVSTPIKAEDGTIIGYDLATNLDTDVNYWITTEIISTTIPSETVLDIAKLTSTTKSPVEVQDIVSDTEGTWARVQEIDTEANTITVVTFHKHAQAVWGTIKGNIGEQADLKEQLDSKVRKSDYDGDSFLVNLKMPLNITPNDLYAITFSTRSLATGSETNGTPFGIVSDDKSVGISSKVVSGAPGLKLEVNSENVLIEPKESGLTSLKLGDAIRELATTKSNATNLVNGTATGSLRSTTSVAESDEYEMMDGAVAFGSGTKATHVQAAAFGGGTTASGPQSFAEGAATTASGGCAHAEGSATTASGGSSHAEGSGTKATEAMAHAEGNGSEASGMASHAEGMGTKATATCAHAEGDSTEAKGMFSHAEGELAVAEGRVSHAEGSKTYAKEAYTHVEGEGTIASSPHQHVQGRYNIEDPKDNNLTDNYLHILGNGTADNKRSNAHTIDAKGNAWFAGNIKIGGTGQNDENAKVLITAEEVYSLTSNTVETINGIGIDENKNITLTGEDINVDTAEDSNTIASLLQDIKDSFVELNQEYVQGKEFFTTSLLGTNNFVHYTHIASGVTLMGRVMKDFTADTIKANAYESFKYDVEIGNISLVGIPEQIPGDDEIVKNKLTGVIPGTLVSGLWVDETSTADFEAYDRDNNVIANGTLKMADVEAVTYQEMECAQFKLDLAEGQTLDTAKENCYGLRISATYEGETMSQTFQFIYDIDNDTFYADQWPL